MQRLRGELTVAPQSWVPRRALHFTSHVWIKSNGQFQVLRFLSFSGRHKQGAWRWPHWVWAQWVNPGQLTSGLWLSRTHLCKVGQEPQSLPGDSAHTQCSGLIEAYEQPFQEKWKNFLSARHCVSSFTTSHGVCNWSREQLSQNKKERIFLHSDFRDNVSHFQLQILERLE